LFYARVQDGVHEFLPDQVFPTRGTRAHLHTLYDQDSRNESMEQCCRISAEKDHYFLSKRPPDMLVATYGTEAGHVAQKYLLQPRVVCSPRAPTVSHCETVSMMIPRHMLLLPVSRRLSWRLPFAIIVITGQVLSCYAVLHKYAMACMVARKAMLVADHSALWPLVHVRNVRKIVLKFSQHSWLLNVSYNSCDLGYFKYLNNRPPKLIIVVFINVTHNGPQLNAKCIGCFKLDNDVYMAFMARNSFCWQLASVFLSRTEDRLGT
jgi:hypothetical protein